jgi:CRP/FNR family transcriptional regulator
MLTVTPTKLAEIPLFEDVAPAALAELADHIQVMEVHAGETLFKQGDPTDRLYLIESGQIHVVRHYDDGEDVILQTLSPYEALGEISMLADERRQVSAITVSDCTLIALERSVLYGTMEKHPQMSATLLKHVAARLHEEHLRLREFAVGSPNARLANLFLLMADNNPGPGVIARTANQGEIARAAGVDAKWLASTLRDWEGKGYIEMDGQTLMLRDLAALREMTKL